MYIKKLRIATKIINRIYIKWLRNNGMEKLNQSNQTNKRRRSKKKEHSKFKTQNKIAYISPNV